ncbi:hypothetical protein H0H87_009780, partial [Tephrocybe sp. NHM501043]
MPESPRFLVKVGRLDEAKEILQRLRTPGKNSGEKEDSHDVMEEYDAIVEAVTLERKHTGMNSYWNMFLGK